MTWLSWCWYSGANRFELKGREAEQLECLSREGSNNIVVQNQVQTLRLWGWLLAGVRDRKPFKEDMIGHLVWWMTMEKGIQYPRELFVVEILCNDTNDNSQNKDPDEGICTPATGRKLLQGAPLSYASLLAITSWATTGGWGPTVDEIVQQILGKSLFSCTSLCFSRVRTVLEGWANQRDCVLLPTCAANVSATRSKCHPVHERGSGKHASWCTIRWFCLSHHREDMKKCGCTSLWTARKLFPKELCPSLQWKISQKGQKYWYYFWASWSDLQSPLKIFKWLRSALEEPYLQPGGGEGQLGPKYKAFGGYKCTAYLDSIELWKGQSPCTFLVWHEDLNSWVC